MGPSSRRCRPAALVAALTTVALLATAQPVDATWSIVGVDPQTGEVGVAVASCVGFEVTVVPVLVPGVGAAASQALISEPSGDRIVAAMQRGGSAQQVLDAVVAADDRPADRQFGVALLDGSGAGWSGEDALEVAVDRRNVSMTVSAQGNILVSSTVIDVALAAFEDAEGSLADRLIAALVAGADAGGDARCDEQTATAAAVLVARPDDPPYAATDAGVFGVDPSSVDVPSVFVSVLVERGGDRAPDRLAELWAGVDRDASTTVIRQVDEGADTAAGRLRLVVGVLLVAVVAVVGGVGLLLARRRRS